MNEVIFKDKRLREWVIKYYGHDGKITQEDLEKVDVLEITTERLQLLDESPWCSVITRFFHTPSDLKKFPKLKSLQINGQLIFWVNLPQESVEELAFENCPILFALIGKRFRTTFEAIHGLWVWTDFKKKGLNPKDYPRIHE